MPSELKKQFAQKHIKETDHDIYILDLLERIPFDGVFTREPLKWLKEGDYAVCHFKEKTDLERFVYTQLIPAIPYLKEYEESEEGLNGLSKLLKIEAREDGEQGEETLKVPTNLISTKALITFLTESYKTPLPKTGETWNPF